jgi:hypothetical protein
VRLLVIGGGGREHALCWALRRENPGLIWLKCRVEGVRFDGVRLSFDHGLRSTINECAFQRDSLAIECRDEVGVQPEFEWSDEIIARHAGALTGTRNQQVRK